MKRSTVKANLKKYSYDKSPRAERERHENELSSEQFYSGFFTNFHRRAL
ncbi:MAG: hypothetical protein PHU32_03935 [Candidatus ainarchaeum sp.]|nr:hypothetical protein [Candidatus ainarchaeum sp.]